MSATNSIAILGRPIAFYPNIARAFGDINTAVIISQFMYWRSKVGDREIYKTREEIEQETSVSQDTQRRIFNKLKKDGLVKITKRGVPAKNYYLWDFNAIDKIISQANSQNQQFAGTRTSNLQEQEPAKSKDKNQQFAGANTETTAKTTTETNNKRKPAPKGLVANTPFEQELIDYRKAIKKPLKTRKGLTGLINSIEQTAKRWNVHIDLVKDYMMQKEWQSIEPSYSNPYQQNTSQQKTASNTPAPAINYFAAKAVENDAEETKRAAQALKELLEGKL